MDLQQIMNHHISFDPAEQARLQSLVDYDVLDTAPEAGFDRITRCAAQIAETPIALVSLVDSNRQWFKSRHGLCATETPRNISFCHHTITAATPMVIENALEDSRFRDSPLVTGEPHIRFYAGAPLITPSGHAIGTLCVIDTKPRSLSPDALRRLCDLAGLVVDQMELRNSIARLAEADSAKNRFFAQISHDFRTPLNAIIGFAEAMRAGIGVNSEVKRNEYLDLISGSGHALHDLVGEMLDLAHGEKTIKVEDMKRVKLRDVLRNVGDDLDHMVRTNKVRIINAIPSDAFALTSRSVLRRVLTNLVSNAIKYNKPGGTVEVGCEPTKIGKIRISVVDTGIGIHQDLHHRVFALYDRLETPDNGHADTIEGTGIGLHLAKQLVISLGGEIGFRSEPGNGSTFWVELNEAKTDPGPLDA
jgi:signal transduction histidine kinase